MNDPLKQVQSGYDQWAAVYDRDANPLLGLEEPLVRSLCGNVAGVKTLDLGCGTGRHTAWLKSAKADVVGVDFSAGMLAEAAKKPLLSDVRLIAHDLHQPLPFSDGEFQLVVNALVLEHIRELKPFFAEIRRVLRPGGRVVISAMHPAMFLKNAQARFTDPTTGNIVHPGSLAHSVCDFVMAMIDAKLQINFITERAPDAEFASRFPRAEKYIGWPMLVAMAATRVD